VDFSQRDRAEHAADVGHLSSDCPEPPKILTKLLLVCVFFNKRLSESKVSVFTRSMRPVMVVHPGGDYEHAQLDSSGVVHVGFGYALATARDDDARSRFELDCKKALADLLRMGRSGSGGPRGPPLLIETDAEPLIAPAAAVTKKLPSSVPALKPPSRSTVPPVAIHWTSSTDMSRPCRSPGHRRP
jgi:hypothetical protein